LQDRNNQAAAKNKSQSQSSTSVTTASASTTVAAAAQNKGKKSSTTAAAATSTKVAAVAQNKGKANKSSTTTTAAAAAATSSAATSTTVAAVAQNQNKHKGNKSSTTTTAAAAANTSAAAASTTDTSTTDTAAAATSTTSAANATASVASNNDPNTSLTLDPSVVETGLEQNGQAVQEAGQVASLTSSNNFINFCVGKTITNGKQVTTGSCNPVVMGDIPAKTNMPTCKFTNPINFSTIPANQPFTISMALNNLQAGTFTNAETTYYMAPQQLNAQGIIIGHTHFVIQALSGSLADTGIPDPTKFAFFKGVNTPQSNGVVSVDVTAGVPAGNYRLASINTSANHAPVILPIAQHGMADDMVYFTAQ
jgi:hypothetical protein